MPPPVSLNIEPEHLTGILSKRENSLTGTLSSSQSLEGTISKNASMPYYDGDYEFTSKYQEDQVIEVTSKVMKRNIVVKKIPSNYGLIKWNGVVMTVS